MNSSTTLNNEFKVKQDVFTDRTTDVSDNIDYLCTYQIAALNRNEVLENEFDRQRYFWGDLWVHSKPNVP